MTNSFRARSTLTAADRSYEIWSLAALPQEKLARLPYSLKILLENLLRFEDGVSVTRADIEALLEWNPAAAPSHEIAFTPARVILQDFTGVPCVVDLAAMREAIVRLGGDAQRVNPLNPAELVIDHSVQVDEYGFAGALAANTAIEFARNRERYEFLRWGQTAFQNFSVVPPSTGIVHQVNLEYLGRVIFDAESKGMRRAYPDTLVGTDSHTTMINGLGVLGWGVGGIEAEAAMLGQPVTMLIPQVIGFRLDGQLKPGATATDLVLTVTEMLRKKGVVDKFVEFFGDGLANLPLADRATIANMAPEYGSTCGLFPIDGETVRYLELSGRPRERIELVSAYAKSQGMWRNEGAKPARYSDELELDLSTVVPSLAGPSRPQDRVPLTSMKRVYESSAKKAAAERAARNSVRGGGSAAITLDGQQFELKDGAVLIAAITSCTNTSNPSVMLGAGLLARKARKQGLKAKPWVKTSLAPGSRVVTDYFTKAGVLEDLDALGFDLVGYGCTDLHRQLRTTEAGDLRRREGRRSHRRRGALRQPQLRRPRASGSAHELPRLPAAGGGVRARRHARHRPHHRAARHRQGRQTGIPRRHLAKRRGSAGTAASARSTRRCSATATPPSSRAMPTGRASRCRPASSTAGTRSPPT